jgi:predicted transcriptional regulator
MPKLVGNVSTTIYKQVEELAEARDQSKSQVVREAIRQELQREADKQQF